MSLKRNLNASTSERLGQLIKKIEVEPRWFNWRWNFFNRLRLNILKIRNAQNVLLNLEKFQLPVSRFSWLWKLCIDLRHNLSTNHFNDLLIAMIINDYYAYENNRLEGKIGFLGKPGFKQYRATLTILESTSKELNFLKTNGPEKFEGTLRLKIENCIDSLRALTNDGSSSLFLDYKELEHHTFYYSSLLSLLRTFGGLKTLSSRPKIVSSSNLNQSDFAAVLHYATEGGHYKRSDLEKEYELFIKTHNLNTSVASLKAAVSAVRKLPRLFANDRLYKIEDIIRKHYPNAINILVNDQKKYYKSK